MIFILLLSLVVLAWGQNKDWSYQGLTGPRFWPAFFKDCGGRKQSPINIDCDRIRETHLQCFDFSDYRKNITDVKIVNLDGKTIEVVPYESVEISGGGSPNAYKLTQFHFHWGAHNSKGSEHTFNCKHYSMEIHFVHVNEKYATVEEAIKHKDGLAVVAVFAKVCNSSSSALKTITDNINLARYANQEADIPFGLPLSDLLPKKNCKYFRYRGSLTTPGCNEAVIWTLLAQPVCVTQSQLDSFRDVLQSAPGENEKALTHNFRPVQPLHGRIIKSNTGCYL